MVFPVDFTLPANAESHRHRAGDSVGGSKFRWEKDLQPRAGLQRYSVRSMETGKMYVCELLDPGDNELLLALATNCMSTTSRTRHQFLANILESGWFKDGSYFHVLDLTPDEKDWFNPESFRKLSMTDFLLAADQLVSALIHMHKSEMVHGSISPGALRADGQAIKICEYWWATDIDGDCFEAKLAEFYPAKLPMIATLCAAPEILNGKRPSRDSDLYSLGCVLFFFLTGEFPRQSDAVDPSRLASASLKALSELRPDTNELALAAIYKMLEHDRRDRASVFEILDLFRAAHQETHAS